MTIMEVDKREKRLVCREADASMTVISLDGVKIYGTSGEIALTSLKEGDRIGVQNVDHVVKAIQLQSPAGGHSGEAGNSSTQAPAKQNKGRSKNTSSFEAAVETYNKNSGAKDIFPDKLPDGVTIGPKGEIKTDPNYPHMVYLPPGTFIQGTPSTEEETYPDERPQRIVTLTRGFWMSKYEVTQGEYLEVMGKNPSFFNGVRHRKSDNSTWDFGVDLRRPVDNVLWKNAWEYCRRITERDQKAGKIPTNWVYRLPTEAEWDYAVRAGTHYTRFHYGDDPDYEKLPSYEWVGISKKNMDPLTKTAPTQPVGQKLPNPWGLHDMGGNVWEWTYDIYGPFHGPTMVTDPIRTNAWKHPYRHALKGAGANSPSRWAKSGARGYDPLTETGMLYKQDMPATVSYVEDWDPNGFRVVLSDWHIGYVPYGYVDKDPDGGRQKE